MNHVEIHKNVHKLSQMAKSKMTTSDGQIFIKPIIFLWYEERELVYRTTNWHVFFAKLITYFK